MNFHLGVGIIFLLCDLLERELEEGSQLLLEKNARFFVRHQMRFKACRDQGQALSFFSSTNFDVVDALNKAIVDGKAELIIRAGDTVRLTKVDVRHKDNVAVMLFRRSDPEATTPIFEHPKTKALRRSDKQPDEAIAVSAHLFIHLAEITDTIQPSYNCILEEVPGLSRTYVQDLISTILREEKYQYTDSRGEEKDTYSTFDLRGIKSEKINNALNNIPRFLRFPKISFDRTILMDSEGVCWKTASSTTRNERTAFGL